MRALYRLPLVRDPETAVVLDTRPDVCARAGAALAAAYALRSAPAALVVVRVGPARYVVREPVPLDTAAVYRPVDVVLDVAFWKLVAVGK